MLVQRLRSLFSMTMLVLLATTAMSGTAISAAQPLETEEFSLTVATAFCEPGYLGPFVGCTPWDGVTVSVLYDTPDGTISDACVTVAWERDATCTVNVPFGQTVTALINPAMIPAGYVLEGAPEVQVSIPDGPPEGLFTGPTFVLFPDDTSPEPPVVPEGFTYGANTAFCEPGFAGPFVGCTPWEGVTVSFVSSDGSFSTSCVTSGTERAAGCSVEVPFGSTIVASIDPAVIPEGYALQGATSVEATIPDGPPDGEVSGASFVLLPVAVAPEPTVPPVQRTATEAPPPGMPVGIYAGTCDAPLPIDAVVQLADAREATGSEVGFPGAVPVATSYTEIDIPFDTLLDGNHLLAVFATGDTEALVACGGLGGSLDDSGALAVGLAPVGGDDAGYPAVAYITPLDDSSRSALTLFVTLPAEPQE